MLKCTFCGAIYEEDQQFCPEDGKPLTPFIIDGRYKILHRIGDGGFGEVYAAELNPIGKKVAIKLLRGAFAKVDAFRQRFEREATAASRLTHLNCVQVTDFGVVDEGPFLVMEFLAGRSLGSVIQKGKLEKKRAIDIGLQILSALSYAHSHGIVHRDLKPDNIMLVDQPGAKGDFCKILDFGLAKMMRDNNSKEKLTAVGMIVGTPSYMSPEQASAGESDHRADIYSMGIVLYELLVGRRPFIGKGPEEVIRAHVLVAPPSPRSLNPYLSAEIDAVLLKALAKKKEERFESAEEFSLALSNTPEARGEEPPLPVVESKPEPSIVPLATKDIEVGGPSLLLASPLAPTLNATAPKPPLTLHKKQYPIIAGAFLLVVIVGYFLLRGEEAPPIEVSLAKSQPTVVAPSEVKPTRPVIELAEDRSTKRAEELLSEENYSQLNKEIQLLKRDEPKNARVYFLHGMLFYKTRKLYDSIEEFAVAIKLDPAYAYDETLLKAATAALGTTFSRGIAKNFFTKNLPKDIAVETLADTTANGATSSIRQGAANALEEMGESSKIERVSKARLDIEQAEYCKDRYDAVRELKESKDPAAIEVLEALDSQGIKAPINSCLGKEVQEAIAALKAQ